MTVIQDMLLVFGPGMFILMVVILIILVDVKKTNQKFLVEITTSRSEIKHLQENNTVLHNRITQTNERINSELKDEKNRVEAELLRIWQELDSTKWLARSTK